MKKGFLTLILAGSLMSAGAENALTGTKFTDNWSVGINAGVTQPLAHPYSIGENIRPQVGVELYKQFTVQDRRGVQFRNKHNGYLWQPRCAHCFRPCKSQSPWWLEPYEPFRRL